MFPVMLAPDARIVHVAIVPHDSVLAVFMEFINPDVLRIDIS
jgi:hypothetical protein